MPVTPDITIAFLWFGPEPFWLPYFWSQVQTWERARLVAIGDAGDWNLPPGIARGRITPQEFEERASEVVGVLIHKDEPRYLGELRCMLPEMFPEHFTTPWWGWAEFDAIWGDLDAFVTDDLLHRFDVISSNAKVINGALTLFRNIPETRHLYRQRPDLLQSPVYEMLDEDSMNAIVRSLPLRIHYGKEWEANDRDERWNRCLRRGRKLYRLDQDDNKGSEMALFHFPGTKDWRVFEIHQVELA